MSASRRRMSMAEFVPWEEAQELRYEFDGLTVEAMVGGTAAHGRIQINLAVALDPFLSGQPCQFFGSDMKLSTGRVVRYPDAMVVCSPISPTATSVSDSTVIFEVLSESTAIRDLTVKKDEYCAISSLRRYITLEQSRIAATVFARDGDLWAESRLVGAGAVVRMPEIGVDGIALAKLYRGLEIGAASLS